MDNKNMTARMSAFARAYHSSQSGFKVFDDSVARRLFTDGEYKQIGDYISSGIAFFAPDFSGTPEEALQYAVNKQLAPAPLERSAFAEDALHTAVKIGTRQYVILAAGYDTFSYRQPEWAKCLNIFEVDLPGVLKDKHTRLATAGLMPPENARFVEADMTANGWEIRLVSAPGYDKYELTFCSMLGITYYLNNAELKSLFMTLGELLPAKSSIVFDFPDNSVSADSAEKQSKLASGAGENMRLSISSFEMEVVLAECGFLVYEHITPEEITERFFDDYNAEHPECPIRAFENVNLCLAVKE